tara:strand:+ start:1675 stop:2448 length:774 start_codon:yes stop_codon:yes gene_type:complete
MKNSLLIARRDLGSFFSSPVFYILTSIFLVLYGYIFFNILNFFSYQSFQASQMSSQMGGFNLNLNEMVIEPSLHNMGVILLLMIPVITMRSFSEEKKNKSFSLLLSSPVHLIEIVLGKFLASLTVVFIMIILTGYCVAFLYLIGQPESGPIMTSYLGVFLMAGCYVAIGIFASALTDNQIVAAVIAFGFTLFMWVIGWGAQATDSTTGKLLNYLSLADHLERFFKGIVDIGDLVYYLSFILFLLFLTHRSLDSQRWK